jgi:hypothetical protein
LVTKNSPLAAAIIGFFMHDFVAAQLNRRSSDCGNISDLKVGHPLQVKPFQFVAGPLRFAHL